MITVVIGGKNSGKSSFAETLLAEMDGNKYYLATMRSRTDEDKKRIEKHRARREGKDFVTIEQDVAIVKAIDKIKWMESLLGVKDGGKNVLVECLPTLAANEMFLESGEVVPYKDVENTVLFGIAFLKEYFDNIIIVSDEEPDIAYYSGIAKEELLDKYSDPESEYGAVMKELNAAVKTYADQVFSEPYKR